MITAAPYGPMWMPSDCTPEQKLPATWDEQVQVSKDCYNAGATLLHIHVRDPKTGHISKTFSEPLHATVTQWAPSLCNSE
jgi:uncharacterized protein (DUF849 family)